MTLIRDWRLRNISVEAAYDKQKKEYEMVLKYKGDVIPISYNWSSSEPESAELTALWTASLQDVVLMWADPASGTVALTSEIDPSAKLQGRSYAMHGKPHVMFKVDPADLARVNPAESVVWKK